MKIWVDADACPGEIKDLIEKAAIRCKIQAIFVSNKNLYVFQSEYISFVKVEQGPDVADAYIADNTQCNDIVITQDIPLASLVIDKGAVSISFHGDTFTPDNISQRLSVRNFMQDLRDTGVVTGGPKPYNKQQKQKFANAFDKQIVKLSK